MTHSDHGRTPSGVAWSPARAYAQVRPGGGCSLWRELSSPPSGFLCVRTSVRYAPLTRQRYEQQRTAIMGKGSPPNRSARTPVPVPCSGCGVPVMRHPSRLKRHKRQFCSRDCYWLSLVGHKQSEETRRKRSAALSGDRAPTWNGGNSRQYKRGYKSEQFKHWRTAVFVRDDYTCQGCHKRGGYLTAHHVKPFAAFPDLRYEVSNGVTLCEPCHAERDNYFARFRPHLRGC